MNTENLESIYQKVAIQLNNIIPESWEKVMVYSEVDEYSDSTVFFYYPKNKQEPWTNLTFELYSTGKFDIEFDYTILEENNYNHYERLIIWKYRNLGIFPDEKRESDVKLIREYINTQK
ncbi:DUF600 family protein [Bacillus sp. Xin]|uniref:immunity protein YezG family protein n=1 Tax=unclassified Bacillus (in: firmicutes) TaxID=185979 RepID=UPI0015732374|nr:MULTISPECIES: immunity protein YezG family protein [unclassified Bacillus (in: firmicutes)]MBC6971157.1 DUF600 family protein [Bacillus sp. Xin]NSW38150.1 DUF600 family protein [Bacillus sp. Xin1]